MMDILSGILMGVLVLLLGTVAVLEMLLSEKQKKEKEELRRQRQALEQWLQRNRDYEELLEKEKEEGTK